MLNCRQRHLGRPRAGHLADAVTLVALLAVMFAVLPPLPGAAQQAPQGTPSVPNLTIPPLVLPQLGSPQPNQPGAAPAPAPAPAERPQATQNPDRPWAPAPGSNAGLDPFGTAARFRPYQAGDLLADCEDRRAGGIARCEGYLSGIVDLQRYGPRAENMAQLFCPPIFVDGSVARQDFARWARENIGTIAGAPIAAVVNAMKQLYPCKQVFQ